MSNHKRTCKGFTLLEVLVAFLILSMALGVILHILSMSSRLSYAADQRKQALVLAESKLAELMSESSLRVGRDQGEFAPPFAWEAEISEWEFPDYDPGLSAPITPYQVTVDVRRTDSTDAVVRLSSLVLVTEEGL